jgi:hypothetical protein
MYFGCWTKNKSRFQVESTPHILIIIILTLIFPYLWAFCSPYTKNRTKQNPNKCGYKARSASGLTSNTQGAADPIQNARQRSSFIFRRIQSTKAVYFKAVTNSKYSIVRLHKTAQ